MAVGTLAVKVYFYINLPIPFLGDTALAILGVGLAPVAACDGDRGIFDDEITAPSWG